MNLQETVQALKVLNIEVAIDLGAHEYCPIQSNCLKAIQLRMIIEKAQVTLAQLLQAYSAPVTPDNPFDLRTDFDITTECSVQIGDSILKIDMTSFVEERVRQVFSSKVSYLRRLDSALKDVGVSLFNNYQRRIQESKRELPQLEYSTEEILRYNCFISSDGRQYYFSLPFIYKPEYIVDSGERFLLAQPDIDRMEASCFLVFTITKEKKILGAKTVNSEGIPFVHYHSNPARDCWGMVRLPETWNGRLASLRDLVHQLSSALKTINYGSLLERDAFGVQARDLLERATPLGSEGVPAQQDAPAVEETPRQERRGWGGRNA